IEPYVCSEFNRRPRSLSELDKWKATEFRMVVLYTGPIILHSKIPEPLFANFMVLHVAVTILCSPRHSHSAELVDYAERLLIHFVRTFASLYGPHCVSHNIHNLIHLASDVRMHGELQKWSAFPFEN
ncbi:unnamed protein product, partial [Ixodes hexagonus]